MPDLSSALSRLGPGLFAGRELPSLGLVRQRLDAPRLDDVEGAARAAAADVIRRSGRAPGPVAVGVGSRGVANLALIVDAALRELESAGFRPFVVPAMGSHGGATAEGQLEVLASYGITEESMRVPVRATMETRVVGEVEGLPVHFDANAAEAGCAFLVARVKPHTDFRGPIESGLAKMSAIGLGKQRGAQTLHSAGIHGLRDLMPEAARLLASAGLLMGGVATVENQRDETAVVRGLLADEFAGPPEEELLAAARSMLPRIPFTKLDVLVVDRMGKDVSGTGMDTNVLNRMRIPGEPEPAGLAITNLVVLDLTEASHGNAVGIGLADFIPARLLEKIDFAAVYTNALTAGVVGVERGQLPIVMASDREAVLAAIGASGVPQAPEVRLAWITDTLHTERLGVSPALWEEARGREDLELLVEPRPPELRAGGTLAPLAEAFAATA